jgi:hypothetical protein
MGGCSARRAVSAVAAIREDRARRLRRDRTSAMRQRMRRCRAAHATHPELDAQRRRDVLQPSAAVRIDRLISQRRHELARSRLRATLHTRASPHSVHSKVGSSQRFITRPLRSAAKVRSAIAHSMVCVRSDARSACLPSSVGLEATEFRRGVSDETACELTHSSSHATSRARTSNVAASRHLHSASDPRRKPQ